MSRFSGTFISERLVDAWSKIPAYYVTAEDLKADSNVRNAVAATFATNSPRYISQLIDDWLLTMSGEKVSTFDGRTYMVCYISRGDWVLNRVLHPEEEGVAA